MRFDGKTNKQRAQTLVLNKLSNVVKPAQGPAIAQIIKSEDEEEVFKLLFETVIEEMEIEDNLREILREYNRNEAAINRSLYAIVGEEDNPDKVGAMRTSIMQFIEALQTMIQDDELFKGAELDKELVIKATQEVLNKLTKEDEMPKEELEKLQKQMDEMTAKLFASDTINGLSEDDRGIYKSFSKEDQEKFVKQETTEEERTAMLQDARRRRQMQKNDETLKIGDTTIAKSEVGEGVFAIIKAQQLQLDSSNKTIKKMEDDAKQKDLEKRAAEMWPNLSGTVEDKARTLKAIEELPQDQQAAQFAMMKTSNEAMDNVFKELGHNSQDVAKGEQALEALAKEIQDKSPELTYHQAYAKAMKTPKGQDIYKEMKENQELH